MKRYLPIVVFISISIPSLITAIIINNSDYLSFFGSLIGSGISVLGAYWVFSIESKKRDEDELECLLALVKFTVMKVDRVVENPENIKLDRAVNIVRFSHELVYDKEWYKYLRLINLYEDKENIIKFFDYIQRDKSLTLGDLIQYRTNMINILKKYKKYDSSLDKEEMYSLLEYKYKESLKDSSISIM